jgi:hypothetical protein
VESGKLKNETSAWEDARKTTVGGPIRAVLLCGRKRTLGKGE